MSLGNLSKIKKLPKEITYRFHNEKNNFIKVITLIFLTIRNNVEIYKNMIFTGLYISVDFIIRVELRSN